MGLFNALKTVLFYKNSYILSLICEVIFLKLTIRIYKRHDLDLLYLYKQESDFNFKETLKTTLKGYVNGKPVKNEIPVGECNSVSSLPTSVQMHIMLDPKTDQDILNWIKGITRGRRNNIIKNVFRNSFPPIENPYKQNSENGKFN